MSQQAFLKCCFNPKHATWAGKLQRAFQDKRSKASQISTRLWVDSRRYPFPLAKFYACRSWINLGYPAVHSLQLKKWKVRTQTSEHCPSFTDTFQKSIQTNIGQLQRNSATLVVYVALKKPASNRVRSFYTAHAIICRRNMPNYLAHSQPNDTPIYTTIKESRWVEISMFL